MFLETTIHLLQRRIETWIVTFDFNPSGETMATIDRFGVCLLSDVNTDSYSFHLDMGKQGDYQISEYALSSIALAFSLPISFIYQCYL